MALSSLTTIASICDSAKGGHLSFFRTCKRITGLLAEGVKKVIETSTKEISTKPYLLPGYYKHYQYGSTHSGFVRYFYGYHWKVNQGNGSGHFKLSFHS